jgi:hypothetical protein
MRKKLRRLNLLETTLRVKKFVFWILRREGMSRRFAHRLYLPSPSFSGEATICLQEWHAIRTGKLTQVSAPGMSSATEPIASSHPGLPNPLAALRGNSGIYNASRPAFVPPSRRPAAASSVVKGDPVTERKIDRSIPELRITATDPVSRPWFARTDAD